MSESNCYLDGMETLTRYCCCCYVFRPDSYQQLKEGTKESNGWKDETLSVGDLCVDDDVSGRRRRGSWVVVIVMTTSIDH